MGKLFDVHYLLQSIPKLLPYMGISLVVAIISIAVGMMVGLVVALVCVYKTRLLYLPARIYISYVRGTPILVQLFLCFYSLPLFFSLFGIQDTRRIPMVIYAFSALGLHLGGFMAETLRAAILAVNKGQLEAAYSIGMNGFSVYTRVILPQAFTFALPDISNLMISTLKNTTLLFCIGMLDIMGKANTMGGFSQRFLELYLAVAIIYIGVSIVLHQIFQWLEKNVRIRKYGC